MVQPYPLPRGIRQTAVLVGDDVSDTYGPFGFSIFDVEDVLVHRADQGDLAYAPASVVVEKTDPSAAFSPFTVTFPQPVPETTQFVVQSRRVHERSSDVTKGIGLDSNALEKELSKQGQVLQEARRDLNTTLRVPFGFLEPILDAPQDGRALMWQVDGLLPRVVNGPTINELDDAAAQAEITLEAAAEFFRNYLGAFATADRPTVDLEGDPLKIGALIYDTDQGLLYVWSGSSWETFNANVPNFSITRLKLTEAVRAGIPVTPYDFGAIGDASADDTAAVSDLFEAAQEIVATDNSTLAQLPCAIDLGIGRYKLTAPLPLVEYGLELRGRGQSLSKLVTFGDFDLIETKEFQSDGVTRNYLGGLVMRDFAIINGDPLNPSIGVKLRNAIRNPYLEKIHFDGLAIGFDVDWCWTLKLRDCWGLGVNGQTNHHIVIRGNAGAVTVDGGRYDVSDDHILLVDGSDQVELIVTNDAAFQFGLKSGIRVNSARSVIIEKMFLEGNCIGNPTEFHCYLNGSGSSLSHAFIDEIVLNNLADANRNGAGILFANNFETVSYSERWSRNDVSIVPKIGTGVSREILNLQSSTAVTAADHVTNFGVNANATAEISQPARPKKYWGRDISAGSLGENGAADFGRPQQGSVTLGTHNGEAAIQSHTGNVADKLEINPRGGEMVLPARVHRTSVTASNWTPSSGGGDAVVDTAGGNRNVLLNGLTWTAEVGQRFEVWKVTSANSLIFVPPAPTDTINGVEGNKSVTATGLYIISKRSATQWMLVHQPLAA